MSSKLHFAHSELSNSVFCGFVSDDKPYKWREGKVDVTGQACFAVAKHVKQFGEDVIVECEGRIFKISVTELHDAAELQQSVKGEPKP